jgi:ABC-type lipoprotein export system ATPase subunit
MNNNVPLIATRDLTKAYASSNTTALDNVSIAVNADEFVCIKGPSGSGKSTLLNALAGLITPTSGDVIFKGTPLSAIQDKCLFRKQHIGFIFQDFYLYPSLSVLENILLPHAAFFRQDKSLVDKAREILAYLNMTKKSEQNVNTLSTGERQRACIARALLHEPPLLLADEPTGSLDSTNGRLILDVLKKINEEKHTAIIMVTHDDNVMRRAQRCIEIIDGRVRANT